MNDNANTAAVARHPLAGQPMSGADTVVQILADEGVDTIFGYSGGAILPIFDAVFRYNDARRTADRDSSVRLVVPANEQGAYEVTRGQGIDGHNDGIVIKNMLACYSHMRDTQQHHWARRFTDFVRKHQS